MRQNSACIRRKSGSLGTLSLLMLRGIAMAKSNVKKARNRDTRRCRRAPHMRERAFPPFRYLAAFPPFDGRPISVVLSNRPSGEIARARQATVATGDLFCQCARIGGLWTSWRFEKIERTGQRAINSAISPRMNSGGVVEHMRIHEESRLSKSEESSPPER